MAAEPPTANWALATKLWVTVLVIEGASGFVSRTSRTARAMSARSSASVRVGEAVVVVVECSDMAVPFRKPERCPAGCAKKGAPRRKRPLCLVSMLPTTVLADRFEGLGACALSTTGRLRVPPSGTPACFQLSTMASTCVRGIRSCLSRGEETGKNGEREPRELPWAIVRIRGCP